MPGLVTKATHPMGHWDSHLTAPGFGCEHAFGSSQRTEAANRHRGYTFSESADRFTRYWSAGS